MSSVVVVVYRPIALLQKLDFTPITSDESELSSARIQLELEDFQLGSARLVGFSSQLVC